MGRLITWSPESENFSDCDQSKRCGSRKESNVAIAEKGAMDHGMWVLKMEEGAMDHGMWVASER